MAFEKIDQYTDELCARIEKCNKALSEDADSYSPDDRKVIRAISNAQFQCLVAYYETALQTAKFITQRNYCRKRMERINPAFCEGYFKTNKKK